MVEALKTAGAMVYATDIARHGYPLDEVMDFLSPAESKAIALALDRGESSLGEAQQAAEAFVARGLQRLSPGQGLALLLPVDFDSGVTRRKFFHDCPAFIGRFVLTRGRLVPAQGSKFREAPKEDLLLVTCRRLRCFTSVGRR